ncbi:hypothetical protein GOV07_00500 [Candidatus Woesearchaeota archaeon]|nr:hypothetical protein [Candidatus Woesearchaeota archaeon]
MVQGKFKSGRFRKSKVKVPGGRTVTRYLERKPKQAHCAETGEKLHGIPRMHATDAKNAPKTTKRPERPYGGVLSSKAMRGKMREEARILSEGTPEKEAELYVVGRVCLKIAGRDAGKRCVIIQAPKDGVVMIDGETRRRKCALRHLEPLKEVLAVKEKAAHADVVKAFDKLGLKLTETKPKKAAARPKKTRKAKEKPVKKEAVKPKEAEKKETPKAVPAEPKVAPAAPAQSPKPAAPSPKPGAKEEGKVAKPKPAPKKVAK